MSTENNGGGLNSRRTKRNTHDIAMMILAAGMATRSTCSRRAVGCVLTKARKVVSTGYNGVPAGLAHCIETEPLNNAAGSCIRCSHAEINAISQADGPIDSAYCTDQPCLNCLRALMNMGVQKIYYWRPYKDVDRENFMVEYSHMFTTHDRGTGPLVFLEIKNERLSQLMENIVNAS